MVDIPIWMTAVQKTSTTSSTAAEIKNVNISATSRCLEETGE